MRILILADIHANLIAFEAVLQATTGKWDYVWCLGDIVGECAQPNECIELLQTLPHLCIAGNYEWAALGWYDIRAFNPDAKASVVYTQKSLTPQNKVYLQNLPVKYVIGDYMLVHGSPREPVWEYMLELLVANLNFPIMQTQYCFVGHTHQAMLYRWDSQTKTSEAMIPNYDMSYVLPEQKAIINLGAVGWGRNGFAEYGILDTTANTFTFHRTEFDAAETIYRMAKANIPRKLIDSIKIMWHLNKP